MMAIFGEFMSYNGRDFLSKPHNLAFTMNFDFFQPYKHVSYSVGAMYLTVNNVPRSIRYKQENVILVGLIPGPHEPKHDINTFIEPFVNELLNLWEGIELDIYSLGKKSVRCALLCIACDLPAGRKLCGFPSYSAHYACSHCFKWFPGSFGAIDYSGFDRHNWPPRCNKSHRQAALSLKNFKTKTEQISRESSAGCKYSSLLKLPYFDAPRMLIVDPMHNLFLGTAKYYLKNIWIEKGLVTNDSFELLQKRVDQCLVPSGIGRIPLKIQSSFSSFTADQWKNWVNYFLLISLQDYLQGDHLECWRHFVLACRLFTKQVLSSQDVILADAFIVQFCRRTESLYGKEIITPNMHMHCHLRSCIEDYGPLHSFWLFAFERYNGILGAIPNNNHCIELQMINRFVIDQFLRNIELPSEFRQELGPRFTFINQSNLVGSLAETVQPCSDVSTQSQWALTSDIVLPSYRSRYTCNDEQVEEIRRLLCKLYPVSKSSLMEQDISRNCWKYKAVQVRGKQIGSYQSRSRSSSLVLATWNLDLFEHESEPELEEAELDFVHSDNFVRPARVEYILTHSVIINGNSFTHVFVFLS